MSTPQPDRDAPQQGGLSEEMARLRREGAEALGQERTGEPASEPASETTTPAPPNEDTGTAGKTRSSRSR
jgi:hypothetical protein